jgi:hypothetical protein
LNGRLERGLELAKSGAVAPIPDSHHSRLYRVLSSDRLRSYRVDLDAKTCECPDSQKGHQCKHRIASYYYEQAKKMQQKNLQPLPAKQPSVTLNPTPITKPAPTQPRNPSESETKILTELGFDAQPKPSSISRLGGFCLGSLYRRFLHGADLGEQSFTVTITDIRKESVLPHPSQSPIEKWCLWVKGLPEGLPAGILFGSRGEQDLIAIFGKVEIANLRGKAITIYPQPTSVAGQSKISIRFRGVG